MSGKRAPLLPQQGPAYMNAKFMPLGHSYNTIGAPPDRMFNNRLAFALGGAPIYQLGIGGATLVLGEQTAGKKSGGWVTLAQNMLRVTNPALSAPSIAPQPFVAAVTTGLNDVSQIAAMTGSPTTGNQKTAIDCYIDVQRATLAYMSSGVFLEAETAFSPSAILTTFTNAAGSAGTNGGSWTAPTGTTGNSGAGWRQTSATGDKCIHGPTTIGSTAELGNVRYVDMFFLCSGFGATVPGSVITFTDENGTQIYPEGYPSGTPFDTSTVRPQYATIGFTTPYWKVARFKVAAGAGRQVIASAGVGGMTVDCITYEADFPPPILWHNIARTPGIAGNSAQLAVIDAINAKTPLICAEFKTPFIRHLDLDACLKYGDPGNVYGMWNVGVDVTHPGEPGQRAIAGMDYDSLATMPLLPTQSVTLGGGLDPAMLPAADLVALTNITLSGASAADGVTPQTGQIVLCTAQTNQAQNGPWVVDTGFNWVRPLSFVTGQNGAGKVMMVRAGGNTVVGGTLYGVVSSTAVIIDTTNHTWTQLAIPPASFAAEQQKHSLYRFSHNSGNPLATVANVNTITQLISIATPAALAGDELVFHFSGDHLNTSGGNVTFTLNLQVGGTNMFNNLATAAQGSGAARGKWVMECRCKVEAIGGSPVIIFSGFLHVFATNNAANWGTPGTFSGMVRAAVDLTAASTLVINVTPSVQNTLVDWRLLEYAQDRIRP